MNSIIWKGVSSTTIKGLLISELPPITKPKMRIKETEIDGRDGSSIEELGYESYTKTLKIGLHGDFDINIVIKYFTGEGDIVFSNEPDKVYKAKICGKIDYSRLLRYRQASIPFIVQPYKYKLNEYLREAPTEAVTGTTLAIKNNAEDKMKSFKIYGKSTQDGTPTLDAPIEIMSLCADGTIAVTVNGDVFDLAVVNKLKGIPVTDKRFATYTDASGQMWCADEIDLERGIYIQRVGGEVLNGGSNEYWDKYPSEIYGGFFRPIPNMMHGVRLSGYCDRFQVHTGFGTELGIWFGVDNKYMYVHNANDIATAFSDWKNWLANNPITIQYILDKAVESALTEEEIETYKTLMSNISTATIINDENAYMMVEYFKPFEVFNEGLEDSKPLMVLKGSGTVEISVNGVAKFSYTFPEGENEVYIDSEKEDAYLGNVLKNRNMNGEFPVLMPKTNIIEWSGDIESISILPRSRWL